MRRELAVGGCGILYLSESSEGSQVEKYLLPKYQRKPEFEQLQQREYELLSQLRHPGVVRAERLELRPSRTGGETSVVILEYLDAVPLHELQSFLESKGEGEREEWLKTFCAQFLSILTYLRHESVVHGDISPENLLITASGRLKLIDFATARRKGDEPLPGVLVGGKNRFRSPESRSRGVSTAEDDLYSAAKLLEFLAGENFLLREPFKEIHAALLKGVYPQHQALGLSAYWYRPLSVPEDKPNFVAKPRLTQLQSQSGWMRLACCLAFWGVLSSPQVYSFLSISTLPLAELQLRSDEDRLEFSSPIDSVILSSGTYDLFVKIHEGEKVFHRRLELGRFEHIQVSEDFRTPPAD